jgi:hypothetical protein
MVSKHCLVQRMSPWIKKIMLCGLKVHTKGLLYSSTNHCIFPDYAHSYFPLLVLKVLAQNENMKSRDDRAARKIHDFCLWEATLGCAILVIVCIDDIGALLGWNQHADFQNQRYHKWQFRALANFFWVISCVTFYELFALVKWYTLASCSESTSLKSWIQWWHFAHQVLCIY